MARVPLWLGWLPLPSQDEAVGPHAPWTAFPPSTTPPRPPVVALTIVWLHARAACSIAVAAACAAAPMVPPASRVASMTPRTAYGATVAPSAPRSTVPATVPCTARCATVRRSPSTSRTSMTRPWVPGVVCVVTPHGDRLTDHTARCLDGRGHRRADQGDDLRPCVHGRASTAEALASPCCSADVFCPGLPPERGKG